MVDGILFALTLLIPVLITIVLVSFLLGSGKRGKDKVKSIFYLDTSKGLVYQGLLWLAIFTPVMLAMSLGGWVWSGYGVELSSEGFKRFIDISILPLAVMSLSLPLAGLVSRFHSTQQTARQIEVVSFKNNLDAFYTHRKELLAYFEAIPSVNYLGVIDIEYKLHPVTHVRFFKGTPIQGWPQANAAVFEGVGRNISAGAMFLTGALEPSEVSHMSALDCYLNACNDIYLAAQSLHVRDVARGLVSRGVMIKSGDASQIGYDMITMGTTTIEALAAFRIVKSYFDNLCDFAGVARLVIPKAHEIVFHGGQRLLDGELVIERLHEVEIADFIAAGRGRYDENHPLLHVA